jgi:hypothetical protein
MHAGRQAQNSSVESWVGSRQKNVKRKKNSRYRIFAQISSSTKSVGKLAKTLWILKERKKKTLNPTWSAGAGRGGGSGSSA